MPYNVKALTTEANYKILLTEPLLSIGNEKERFPLIRKIMKTYEVRLNDIKFNTDLPSNRLISFFKFYDRTVFDAGIGAEEINVEVRAPKDEKHLYDLLGSLYKIVSSVKGFNVSRQQLTAMQHLSMDVSIAEYFDEINPATPEGFRDLMPGKGVIYNFKYEEHDLFIQLVLTVSLLFPEAIYLRVDYDFFPNKYNYNEMYKVAKNTYEFICEQVGIKIVEE